MLSLNGKNRNEMESKKAGKGSFAYAWVLDETEEERTRYMKKIYNQSQLSRKKFSKSLD